jgi:hypothetical protein
MRITWFRAVLSPKAAILLLVLSLGRTALAQEVSVAVLRPEVMQPPAMSPSPLVKPARPTPSFQAEGHERFWDRENSLLFATSAAFSAADFVVTKDNLRSGGQEFNPVTRVFGASTAGLAANFAGEAAGVVGLSYMFHKTGHHKLERYVSMLNIGSSAAAVSFDLAHR